MKYRLFLIIGVCCLAVTASTSAHSDKEESFLIAKKREIIIPANIKPTCVILKTEQANSRIWHNGINKTRKDDLKRIENNLKLDIKRIESNGKTAKNAMSLRVKNYKPEEVKSAFDAFNAGVDAAVAAYNKAVNNAFAAYQTNLNGLITRRIKVVQRHYANLKKNVCSGDFKKEKNDINYYNSWRNEEGFLANSSEYRSGITSANTFLNVVKGAAQTNFKKDMQSAEKARNDALKLLKRVK